MVYKIRPLSRTGGDDDASTQLPTQSRLLDFRVGSWELFVLGVGSCLRKTSVHGEPANGKAATRARSHLSDITLRASGTLDRDTELMALLLMARGHLLTDFRQQRRKPRCRRDTLVATARGLGGRPTPLCLVCAAPP